MTLTPIAPTAARAMIVDGATLIDIRSPAEARRERVACATNHPLGNDGPLPGGDAPVIFYCRSGMRTAGNAAALAALAGGRPAYHLEGGIAAWRKAGLPVQLDRGQPIEIMRQVQIAAGVLILLGVILGWLVAPPFFGLAAFVGAGLTFAGVTGFCGMARLLQAMPWNRSALAG